MEGQFNDHFSRYHHFYVRYHILMFSSPCVILWAESEQTSTESALFSIAKSIVSELRKSSLKNTDSEMFFFLKQRLSTLTISGNLTQEVHFLQKNDEKFLFNKQIYQNFQQFVSCLPKIRLFSKFFNVKVLKSYSKRKRTRKKKTKMKIGTFSVNGTTQVSVKPTVGAVNYFMICWYPHLFTCS